MPAPPLTLPDPYTGAPGTNSVSNEAPPPGGQPSTGTPTDGMTPDQIKAKQAADAAAAAAEANRAMNAHFQYGGWAGGANEAASRYAGLGAAAQGRQGEQLALGSVNQDRNNNLDARAGANGMAGLLAARANGSMPLISGMRANQDMNRAIADQSSIAASARGPAGLALAQQQQANNSASAVSNISNNAQINGAQEQLNNTVAAGNAFNSIRGGDQGLMGADTGVSVAQAQLNQQQRAANDAYQLGMTGYETGVQNSQLGAQGNQVAIAAGQAQARAALAQNQSQFDDNRTDKYIGYGLGAAGTAAGVAAALFSGGSGAAGPPPNSGSTSNPAGDNGLGSGGYGQPGSTPGGYDAGTGAPVAGTGGGYDPDHPGGTSDVTAKQHIRPVNDSATEAFAIGARDGSRPVGAPRYVQSFTRDNAQGQPMNVVTTQEPRMRQPVTFSRDDANGQALNVRTTVDHTTGQLASGLAPSTYEYKPGYGTPGEKFGPMAQNMASNPATATAVRSDPARGGLMSIDSADGLKVALGGVGHLAQKQTETEQELQRIKGLLAQQPSIGQRYLATVRGGR